MAIISPLPNNIANGQAEDATVVMANFNAIVNNVNANAAALSLTPQLASSNTFTQPQIAANAVTAAQISTAGQVQNDAFKYLTSVAGTNAITGTAIALAAYAVGQEFGFIPAATNTTAVTLNVSTLGAGAVQLNGAALIGGELQINVPVNVRVTAATPVFEIIANGSFLPKSGGAMIGPLKLAKSANIASASTVDLSTATGNEVHITGSTGPITSFGTVSAGAPFTLIFDSTPTITYNATSMILPGGANITAAAGDAWMVVSEGSGNWRVVSITAAAGFVISSKIQPIAASVGSNALTLILNPTVLDFRSSTIGSGTVNTRTVGTAISVVVPSTATLGTVNAIAARLVILAIDNSGTVELAVVNMAGGNNLDETTVINTTTIAGGSNTANVIYSTTGRTGVPFRVVGFVDITEATAGTWATAPSTTQGYGGQALAAMSSLGFGQTWQNVIGSRANATTYYNTTGKPIAVSISVSASVSNAVLTISGVTASLSQPAASTVTTLFAIVPPGASFSASYAGTYTVWAELR